ncbi:MAG TPA: 50S ribosomal protein L10 [Acidimicrobiales bacterium]|nr:50S ribosomal protein L10 [Acidimicrobiales bacterium]
MDNPRPDKVAVVDEVRERLAAADGALLTEYRGLTVSDLAALRRELVAAGGDYKIYKNTLVRLAVADGPQSALVDLLTGPTAIAFVHGDVSAVAKALRTFSRENGALVVKGGMVDGGLLTAADIEALATLPSRDALLAQLAGGLAAPLQQLAGLLEALPRNLAYGLSALVDQRRQSGEGSGEDPGTAEAPVAEADPAAGTAAVEAAVAEDGADEDGAAEDQANGAGAEQPAEMAGEAGASEPVAAGSDSGSDSEAAPSEGPGAGASDSGGE